MQQLIEKHSTGLIFGIVALMIVGYIDMRTLVGSMSTSLARAVVMVEETRSEQLLRTDEIEWVQHMRKVYPGKWTVSDD